MKDGMDLLASGDTDSFRYLSGRHIPQFCAMAAKVQGKFPIYERHAMEQLSQLDAKLCAMIKALYKAEKPQESSLVWEALCDYLLNILGNHDIREYQVVTSIGQAE